MPKRARKEALRFTTTSTATPISTSGRTSNSLFKAENSEAQSTFGRCPRACLNKRRSGCSVFTCALHSTAGSAVSIGSVQRETSRVELQRAARDDRTQSMNRTERWWGSRAGVGVARARAVCLAAACLGSVGLGLACSGSSPAPHPPPAGTNGPKPQAPAPSALEVVYAGPRAEATLGSSIQLLFNQPLRAAESAAASAPPALELEPTVPGQWQWLGSRALTFFPSAGRLPAATSFHVVVPAGTRALGGASLAQPFVFDFETPAPAVISSEPAPGSDGEEPDVQLRLRFNQPVSAAALERAGQLRALRGSRAQRLEFSARPRADHPNELELAPRQPLPLGSRIELRVPAGLRGSEGPRPLAADYVLAFDTYAPLRVVAIDCNVLPDTKQCDPEGSLWVELNNPVSWRELKSHLTIEPAPELSWPEQDEGESRYVYLPLAGTLAAGSS